MGDGKQQLGTSNQPCWQVQCDKVYKKAGTKEKPWHWDKIHQDAFDKIKQIVARDICMAYLDYTNEFEIFTDASSRQLGAVIVQDNRPIMFFSYKPTKG